MSIPRTVAEILREHVTLEVEGIDQMYLKVYVPARQRAGGVARFFRYHLGHRFTYSPYNAKLCLNGHEYVKQQLIPR